MAKSIRELQDQSRYLASYLISTAALFLSLHHPYDCPDSPRERPKSKTPPLDPHTPNKEIHQCPVTHAKGQEDAEIAPLLISVNIQRSQILVATNIRAIHAVCRRLGVEQIPRSLGKKITCICGTRLARRGGEDCGFGRVTVDGLLGEGCGEDATDPVGGGVDPVPTIR